MRVKVVASEAGPWMTSTSVLSFRNGYGRQVRQDSMVVLTSWPLAPGSGRHDYYGEPPDQSKSRLRRGTCVTRLC